MPKPAHICILLFLVLITLGPLLVYQTPLHVFSPDIQYVKAKVLRVMAGEPYADPVSGYSTFHPPIYHLFIALFHKLGLSLDVVLLLITVINNCLLVLFVYLFIHSRFGSKIAIISVLIIPFIAEFINMGSLLLASAFYFSLPIFLAGLWVFGKESKTSKQALLTGLLWGVAFIISPCYLFLVGLALLYEMIIFRNVRFSLIVSASFVIALIPFFVQAYVVFSQGMYGTSAFSFWRGLPDGEFLFSLAKHIFSPDEQPLSDPIIWIGFIFTLLGIIGFIRFNKNRHYIIIFAFAFWFTYYHYMPRYAVRVHLILLFVLTAYAVQFIIQSKYSRYVTGGIIIGIALFGIYRHYDHTIRLYIDQETHFESYNRQMKPGLIDQLAKYTGSDDMLLASADTYRYYIIPNIAVRAHKAWRTGEYYQLKTTIADALEKDYERLIQCPDTNCLYSYCQKYNIHIAVVHGPPDLEKHKALQLVDQYWQKIYNGVFFRIYQRP